MSKVIPDVIARPEPKLGPGPVFEEDEDLVGTKRRVLGLVSESGDDGIRVADIANKLGGHPNRARVHLDDLADKGLIEVHRAEPNGRGRPASSHVITAAGKRELAGHDAASCRTLTSAFADYLATADDPDVVRRVGTIWAQTAALEAPMPGDGTDEGVDPEEALFEILTRLDFSPERSDDGTTRLTTCPFITIARGNPTAICQMHRGLIEGALQYLGVDAEMSVLPFAEPGACKVALQLKKSPAETA